MCLNLGNWSWMSLAQPSSVVSSVALTPLPAEGRCRSCWGFACWKWDERSPGECPNHQDAMLWHHQALSEGFSSADGILKKWILSLARFSPWPFPPLMLSAIPCFHLEIRCTSQSDAAVCAHWGEHQVWLHIPGQHRGTYFCLGLVSTLQLVHAHKHSQPLPTLKSLLQIRFHLPVHF